MKIWNGNSQTTTKPQSPGTIDWANAITSGSVLGNLAILQFLLAVLRTWRSRSMKSFIPLLLCPRSFLPASASLDASRGGRRSKNGGYEARVSPVWCPQISRFTSYICFPLQISFTNTIRNRVIITTNKVFWYFTDLSYWNDDNTSCSFILLSRVFILIECPCLIFSVGKYISTLSLYSLMTFGWIVSDSKDKMLFSLLFVVLVDGAKIVITMSLKSISPSLAISIWLANVLVPFPINKFHFCWVCLLQYLTYLFKAILSSLWFW